MDHPSPLITSEVTAADWERSFKMIELENQLANHRLTGLLTLQGFFFTATAIGLTALVQTKIPILALFILLLLILAGLVGSISPWLIQDGIVAAYRQVNVSAHWLRLVTSKKMSKAQIGYFPPIVGIPTNRSYNLGEDAVAIPDTIKRLSTGIPRLPSLLLATWIVLTISTIVTSYFYIIGPGWACITTRQGCWLP